MIRHGKREAGNYHVRKRFPWHIDPHPKAVRPEENASRRRLELFQKLSARRSLPLHQQGHGIVLKKFGHFSCELLHDAIARKQNKGASFRLGYEMAHPMGQRRRITGISRVRHFADDKKFHLLREIEWAAELKRLDFVGPDPFPKVRKVRPADG